MQTDPLFFLSLLFCFFILFFLVRQQYPPFFLFFPYSIPDLSSVFKNFFEKANRRKSGFFPGSLRSAHLKVRILPFFSPDRLLPSPKHPEIAHSTPFFGKERISVSIPIRTVFCAVSVWFVPQSPAFHVKQDRIKAVTGRLGHFDSEYTVKVRNPHTNKMQVKAAWWLYE